MAANFVFTVQARDDASDAFNWYENQRVGLGEKLFNCINETIQKICEGPERHPVEYRNCRRAHVQKFPYSIIYEFDGELVTVVSVNHAARDPGILARRLK